MGLMYNKSNIILFKQLDATGLSDENDLSFKIAYLEQEIDKHH